MIGIPVAILVVAVAFIVRRARSQGRRGSTRSMPNLASGVSSSVGLVATREVQQRLRGRTFRVATGAMLLAIAAAIVIPTLGGKGTPKERIAVTSATRAATRSAALASGKQVGATVEFVEENSTQSAITAVKDGSADLAIVNGELLVKRALSAGDGSTKAQLARALALFLAERQAFSAAKLTPTQVGAISNIRPVTITGLTKARTSSSEQGTAVIGLILLFVMLSQYGTWTLIGVMEEKASRVVEVLLAAIRPNQLLGGKVLGIGTLVFGQATILVGFALGLGAAVGSNILKGTAPTVVVAILGWLVLGYAFYSWVFAAAGSMVERQDQVQAIAFPVTIPLLIGYISSITAITSDHASAYVTTLAYLPPTAPFAMPVLVSLHAVTWWEFALSALITIAATVVMARFAALVYRRAVLRTGRRVPFREVLVSPARSRSR